LNIGGVEEGGIGYLHQQALILSADEQGMWKA